MTSENNPRSKRGDAYLTGRTFEVKNASLNNTQDLSKQISVLTEKIEKLTY